MLKQLTGIALTVSLLTVSSPAQFAVFPDRSYWLEQWQEAPYGVEIESVSMLDDYYVDGRLELSDRPGFGMELDESKIEKRTRLAWD